MSRSRMILVRVSPGCHPGEAAKIAAGPLACCQPSSSSSCSVPPFPFPFFYNSEFQLWADFSWEFLEVVLLPLLLIPTESNLENMMPRIAMILCQQWSTAHLYGGVEEKLDHHSDVTNITWLTYSNANGPWSQHNSLCTGFRFFDNCNFLSWKVEQVQKFWWLLTPL